MYKHKARVTTTAERLVGGGGGAATDGALNWNAVYNGFLERRLNSAKARSNPLAPEYRSQGVFHPSAGLHPDSTNCVRSIMFDLYCAAPSDTYKPIRMLRAMQNGSNRHVGIQSMFRQMADEGWAGIQRVDIEPSLYLPSHSIRGSADLIVHFDKHRVLIDIKTISDAEAKNVFEPLIEHRWQVNTYMGIAGVHDGYVLYENRGSLEFLGPPKRFRIAFDPTMWHETLRYCSDILDRLYENDLPEFEQTVCDANVLFCPYVAACKAHRETGELIDARLPDMRYVHEHRRLPIIGKER